MSIEVLNADERGSETLQRWAAMGLPVPPSWRIDRETVQESSTDELVVMLGALPDMFGNDRYWVLQQGPMNEDSLRESLLNLDSDEALAAALQSIFQRSEAPEQAVIQALPHQRAAGVLFTRHPLRQDLAHMVVEGVVDGSNQRQRLIFEEAGRLVHRSDEQLPLDELVGQERLVQLYDQLKHNFERPQAGEWVFDGERLWLLQTLPVGSLPTPREAWTRRAGSSIFSQAVTPLWYTLAGRWLKTGFWQPLVQKRQWGELERIEPYRRQHSHIYTNCQFYRRLVLEHPSAIRHLPPAWHPLEAATTDQGPSSSLGKLGISWRRLALQRLQSSLRHWRIRGHDRNSLWHALMRLDALGERLARYEGELGYLVLLDAAERDERPFPLSLLVSGEEERVIRSVAEGCREGLKDSRLRPGDDPVHAPLCDHPPQYDSLDTGVAEAHALSDTSLDESDELAAVLELARACRRIRYMLGNRVREVLQVMSAVLFNEQLLQHVDDIHFLYFDELWQLWMERTVPPSANADTVGERKVRYLEDAHKGAPDWTMDQVGYGFGGGNRLSPVLRGRPLVKGKASGKIRRLCSAWGLNRIAPGDIVVVDQVEPSWLPWLVQAAGLVIAERDPLNGAASLAVACSIPAIWAVNDVMHSVRDGVVVTLNADAGVLDVNEELAEEGEPSDTVT